MGGSGASDFNFERLHLVWLRIQLVLCHTYLVGGVLLSRLLHLNFIIFDFRGCQRLLNAVD